MTNEKNMLLWTKKVNNWILTLNDQTNFLLEACILETGFSSLIGRYFMISCIFYETTL